MPARAKRSLTHPKWLKLLDKISPEAKKSGRCAQFVREAAEHLYDMRYKRGHAWEMAERNRSVWRRVEGGRRPELRPGQILGLFFPDTEERPKGREYTHMALYTGNGTIVHNFLGTLLHERLDDFVRRSGCDLREIIALRKEHKAKRRGPES